MSKDLCKKEGSKVLLVEGANDCHVVLALCKAHHLPESFGIYECGSNEAVLKRLNALIPSSNRPEVIGVVLDADRNIGARWSAIQQKVKDHGYTLPDIPVPEGTIVVGTSDQPKLGFWLMPDNATTGMLEDFCAHLAEPKAFSFAEECVREAVKRGVGNFKESQTSKAVLHTYLAWQEIPGQPLGLAITAQT